MKNFELTAEFKLVLDIVEKEKQHVFISGKAGTGKSTLLHLIREHSDRNVAVVAPTGLAALHVKGTTIHKFFKLFPGSKPDNIQKSKFPQVRTIFKKLDILIIDEVSMLRADLLDCMDQTLRLNRNKDIPMGGVQVIFVGDMFQLPPVVRNDEFAMFAEQYESPYFFSAEVMKEMEVVYIELTKIFRQKNKNFISLLNSIRNNECEFEDFEQLNKRFQPNFVAPEDEPWIILTSTNQIADQINQQKLRALPDISKTYIASIQGQFDEKQAPAEYGLELKKGAQVLFIKNDPDGKFVNGSIGTIVDLYEKTVQVDLEGEIFEVEPLVWDMYQYKISEKGEIELEIIGNFTQLPLRLAWAITIHKSQGLTFERVIIDTGKGTFAHGQLYVALSRCTSLEGVILKNKIQPRDIIVDQRIVEFVFNLNH